MTIGRERESDDGAARRARSRSRGRPSPSIRRARATPTATDCPTVGRRSSGSTRGVGDGQRWHVGRSGYRRRDEPGGIQGRHAPARRLHAVSGRGRQRHVLQHAHPPRQPDRDGHQRAAAVPEDRRQRRDAAGDRAADGAALDHRRSGRRARRRPSSRRPSSRTARSSSIGR